MLEEYRYLVYLVCLVCLVKPDRPMNQINTTNLIEHLAVKLAAAMQDSNGVVADWRLEWIPG